MGGRWREEVKPVESSILTNSFKSMTAENAQRLLFLNTEHLFDDDNLVNYLDSDCKPLSRRKGAVQDAVRKKLLWINHARCLVFILDGREFTIGGTDVLRPAFIGRHIQPFIYAPTRQEQQQQNSVEETTATSSSSHHSLLSSPRLPRVKVDNFALLSLNEGAYVSDAAIDFYLAYLYAEVMTEQQRRASHTFGCFFYNHLLTSHIGSFEDHVAECGWTRRVALFHKDFLFMPMCIHSHWILAVVCFPWLVGAVQYEQRHLGTRDGASDTTLNMTQPHNLNAEFHQFRCDRVRQLRAQNTSPMPCVIIFDSMSTPKCEHRTILATIRRFLHMEWNQKYAADLGQLHFTKSTMRGYLPKVHYQLNGSDCGVHCLSYASYFTTQPICNFSKAYMESGYYEIDMMGDQKEFRVSVQQVMIERYRSSGVAASLLHRMELERNNDGVGTSQPVISLL